MKSYVNRRFAEAAVEAHYHKIPSQDGGWDIDVSSTIRADIREQAPNIRFSRWHLSDKKVWTTKAECMKTGKIIFVSGNDIRDCIEKAKAEL
jgi:hypothetical protein